MVKRDRENVSASVEGWQTRAATSPGAIYLGERLQDALMTYNNELTDAQYDRLWNVFFGAFSLDMFRSSGVPELEPHVERVSGAMLQYQRALFVSEGIGEDERRALFGLMKVDSVRKTPWTFEEFIRVIGLPPPQRKPGRPRGTGFDRSDKPFIGLGLDMLERREAKTSHDAAVKLLDRYGWQPAGKNGAFGLRGTSPEAVIDRLRKAIARRWDRRRISHQKLSIQTR